MPATPDSHTPTRDASWLERKALELLIGLGLAAATYIWGVQTGIGREGLIDDQLRIMNDAIVRLEVGAANRDREMERLRVEIQELRRELRR